MPWKKGFKSGHKIQLVVPEIFRKEILGVKHDLPLAGHTMFKRTLTKIRLVFYWSGILNDIKKYLDSCQICQKIGYASGHRKVTLGNIPVVQTPFAEFQIDIQRPFVPSRS